MKTNIHQHVCSLVIGLALISYSRDQVRAGTVTWTIDSAQSVVRLNLPDQTLSVDGTSVLVQIRNSNNAAWSDAGGRASFVTGTLATNYSETASSATLTYLQGSHNASAIQFGSFRPNPAAFNPSNTNADNPDGQFSNTSGAPAAFAAKIRGVAGGFLTLDLAFLAIRDVQYDFGGTALLSGSDGSFTGGQSQTTLGLASGSASIDGLSAFLVGQVIPDINNADISDLLGSALQTNSASLQIATVGSQRRLTQQINTPLTFDVDGTLVNGFINGQIVAFSAVPEPSSIALVVLSLGFFARRLTVLPRR